MWIAGAGMDLSEGSIPIFCDMSFGILILHNLQDCTAVEASLLPRWAQNLWRNLAEVASSVPYGWQAYGIAHGVLY